MVAALAEPGDYVICLGAGTISAWAYALPDEISALQEKGLQRKGA
jgi:UDP-N-acetylmuramate--alanine ligase